MTLPVLNQSVTSDILQAQVKPAAYREQVLLVHLVGLKKQAMQLVLQAPNGDWLLAPQDLKDWRIRLPKVPLVTFHQRQYYPLSAIPGASASLNSTTLTLNILIPANQLETDNLSLLHSHFVTPERPAPGAFVNYDTFAQLGQDHTVGVSGLFTLGLFNRLGNLTSGLLGQQTSNNHQWIRLNSTWQTDEPAHIRSFRLGDTYSSPGMWGQSVDFGGFSIARNFATQPGFVTFPLPRVSGDATVPSAVALFVNNALAGKRNLPPGPFSINTIPVVTGAGQVTVVTTNLLGQQQVISVPYYASESLLKPGLNDYDYDFGFIRRNFGIKSDDYGRLMAVGTDRVGLTDNLTGEWHAELLANQQTAGVGDSYLLGDLGVLNSAVAISQHHGLPGILTTIGFSRQNPNGISIGSNVQVTNHTFTEVGVESDEQLPSLELQLFTGIPIYKRSSVGLSYTRQDNRNGPHASLLNAGYNQTLSRSWSLNVSALHNLGGVTSQAIYLTLTYAFAPRTTINLSGNAQPGLRQGSVQISHSLPVGSGFGYNVLATGGQEANSQATVYAQSGVGTYSAGFAQQDNQQAYRFEALGSVAWLDHGLYASRALGSSFAVVKVPGFSHVGVYNDNQLVGYTNSSGNVLVPNLLPYQKNRMTLDLKDLPLSANLQENREVAIPYVNSGIIVRFPVQPLRAGIVYLLQTNGKPVPLGATIFSNSKRQPFPVGYHGKAYLPDMQYLNSLLVKWDGHSCLADVAYPKIGYHVLPDLGEVICQP